jgi:hypothetical protein
LIVVGFGLWRVVQLRRRVSVPQRTGGNAAAALAAVFVLLLLMHELPYRIVSRNRMERVQYNGERCYIIGRSQSEWLLFCPAVAPPRNRIVTHTDPSLRRTGAVESIFTIEGNE